VCTTEPVSRNAGVPFCDTIVINLLSYIGKKKIFKFKKKKKKNWPDSKVSEQTNCPTWLIAVWRHLVKCQSCV